MITFTAIPALDSSIRSLSGEKSPFESIVTLLQQRYPEAPTPTIKWCRAYYIRCASQGTDGGLVAVYFPPSISYVFDLGYENLVIFNDVLQANITGDPTFPHWENGTFYGARKEEAVQILYPFVPRDLLVGTSAAMSKEEMDAKLAMLGATVEEQLSGDSFRVITPAFREDAIASKILALEGIRYVERNGVVRIIDIHPGWLIDRIF